MDQPSYMQRNWMGYPWSAWMPLMAAHPLALAQLPSLPGLYRIRPAGRLDRLEWLAWEERGVRVVIERLSRQVHLPVEPYDDPTGPARMLWDLRRSTAMAFEVSGALLVVSPSEGEHVIATLREQYHNEFSRVWEK